MIFASCSAVSFWPSGGAACTGGFAEEFWALLMEGQRIDRLLISRQVSKKDLFMPESYGLDHKLERFSFFFRKGGGAALIKINDHAGNNFSYLIDFIAIVVG
jgi:hypothetical protein